MPRNMDFEPSLQTILVVFNFLNVFRADSLSLHAIQKIEFSINLICGTQPISNPTYQTKRIKLVELVHQITALWQKKFIRPNHSPWGALVLFLRKKDGTL